VQTTELYLKEKVSRDFRPLFLTAEPWSRKEPHHVSRAGAVKQYDSDSGFKLDVHYTTVCELLVLSHT
jgi:hypothetical protein